MQWGEFAHQFASRFRPLGSDDGVPEWIREIEKPEIEAGVMRVALARIDADHRDRAGKTGYTVASPRLGEVLAVYREVEAEEDARPYQFPDYKCAHCEGYGWCWTVKHSTGFYADPGRLTPRGPGHWYLQLVPCHCPAGGQVLAPKPHDATKDQAPRPYPQAYRDGLRRYHCGPVGNLAEARETWNRQLEIEAAAAASKETAA